MQQDLVYKKTYYLLLLNVSQFQKIEFRLN